MGRRKNDDVFVLGEESIAAEATALRIPDLDRAAQVDQQAPDGLTPSGLADRPEAGARRGPRRLAVLGLGAAAASALGILELSLGSLNQPQPPDTSPRSALALPGTPSAASPSAPTGSPSSHPRQPESSRADQGATRRRSEIARRESKREPNPPQAPEGSPAPISEPPVAPPAPTPAPPPSNPSPPAGGGGSGGTEQFGFEH